MQENDQQQRLALVEGFINMSDMDALREDQDARIFARASRGDLPDRAKDYVDMEDGYLPPEGSADGEGKVNIAELKENTNIFKSAFHVFKANVGTGVFLLPKFYIKAGYVVSVLLALMIGSVVVDCTHLLLKAKLAINRRDVTTYSQICKFVMGKALAWFLFIALCLTQFGFCLMYSQLFSATMEQLVDLKHGQYLWVSLMFLFNYPMTCFSDNLSLLSIASITATVGVFYCVICCIIESFRTIAAQGGKPHPSCDVAGNDIPVGWFDNVANNMMVLEGIAIILPVHAACTQKRLVPRMITIVLTAVIACYLLFGLTGYLAFGNTIQTSLVNTMAMDAWGTSIRVLFMVNLIFTYPVQFMSAQQLIDQLVKCKPRSWVGLGMRLFLNLVIWGLAMGVPSSAVGVVVSLIGALPSTWIVIIIPCILSLHVGYACTHIDEDRNSWHYWKVMMVGEGGRWSWLRIRCWIYLFLAVLIMVIGTYSIFVDIFKSSDDGGSSPGQNTSSLYASGISDF